MLSLGGLKFGYPENCTIWKNLVPWDFSLLRFKYKMPIFLFFLKECSVKALFVIDESNLCGLSLNLNFTMGCMTSLCI